MTALLLTTHGGLEELASGEVRERAAALGLPEVRTSARPGGHVGRVEARCDVAREVFVALARELRSVHHVLRLLEVFELDRATPVASIRSRIATLEIDELARATSFCVRTRRHGKHAFGSPDVERACGGALVARTGLPVRLEDPDVCVRADVRGHTCTFAVEVTSERLSQRHARRPYHQETALKPTIAYAALRLAGLGAGPLRLLDPFCGSGTILLEAAQLHPGARLFGSDTRAEAADGTRANLAHAGHADRSEARTSDARSLERAWGAERFDAVVTNPPYGARMGRALRFDRLYGGFLESLRPLLPAGAPVVVLGLRPGTLVTEGARAGFSKERELAVSMGNVRPSLVVLRAV